jgi:hypothetical protein
MIVDRESLPDTSVPHNERAKKERQKREKTKLGLDLPIRTSFPSDSSSASLQSDPLLPCNSLGRNLHDQAIRDSSNQIDKGQSPTNFRMQVQSSIWIALSLRSELSESPQSFRFAILLCLGLGGVIADLSFSKVNWTHYCAIACETCLFNATILSKLRGVSTQYMSCQGPCQLSPASHWSTWTARWSEERGLAWRLSQK